MAIVKMEKYNIVGIQSEKETIFDAIQSFSQAEIIDDKSALEKELKRDVYFEDKEKAEYENAEIQYVINFLDKHYTGKKPGLFESFIGNKINITNNDVSLCNKMDTKKIISSVKGIEEKSSEIDQAIEKNKAESIQLAPYKNIDFLVSELKNLSGYKITIGTVNTVNFENMIADLAKITKLIAVNTLSSNDEKTKLFYLVYPENISLEKIEHITKTLSNYKFMSADFLFKYDLSPKKIFANLASKINRLNSEKDALVKSIQTFMCYRLPLMCKYDQNNWKIESQENIGKSVKTDKTFIISIWVPEKNSNELKRSLESVTHNLAFIKAKIEKNDTPPTALDNPDFMKPFEAVTNIYGMPKYSEPDPTAYLAIFFVIFLALCLTDAGYGIVMVIATYFMLKFVDLPDTRLVKLLNYSGWVTIIIGALTGGWFGVDLNSMAGTPLGNLLLKIRLVDPISDPITIMLLALALGIVHVWFGIFVKFNWKRTHGNAKDAWLDDFPWVYMVGTIILFVFAQLPVFGGSLNQIALYLLYSGVAAIVFTQGRSQKNILMKLPSGAFKLYDIVGYFSDTLSYSRLLALGLATAIIGLVVNMIAGIFGQVPYVGWLLMIAVLLIGHTFNLVVNLLGGFIHAARLQYVEFFTKFLEGGGQRFKPLKKNNIYTNIK